MVHQQTAKDDSPELHLMHAAVADGCSVENWKNLYLCAPQHSAAPACVKRILYEWAFSWPTNS